MSQLSDMMRNNVFTKALCIPEAKPFRCLKCFKTYKNKGSLKRHVDLECFKQAKYKCDFCDYKTKQKANCERHKSTIHGEVYRRNKTPCTTPKSDSNMATSSPSTSPMPPTNTERGPVLVLNEKRPTF